MDSAEIGSLINQMEEECNAIRANSLKMAWYMRGGISYTDVMNLSLAEREAVNKLIADNLETTKNSKLPFF